MLVDLVPLLRCPWCAASDLDLRADRTDRQEGSGGAVVEGHLRCPACGRATQISGGVWDAMGPKRAARTPAQITNRLRLVAAGYERVWRRRSLTLLSGRRFPLDEERAELRAALARLDGPSGTGPLVVDVACSEGLYARWLAEDLDATVLAVDHSAAFLRRVVTHRGPGQRIVPVRALAQHLPIADAALDAAVVGGSLNEIGDRDGAVHEMSRVTRPGGRCFSMSLVAAGSTPGRVLQALLGPSGIAFPTAKDTTALFSRHGWTVDSRDVRRDRVVLRLTGERPAGSA